ncbi:MAG: hypothetical protein KC636_23575 [Myxococcales bacterium]|nr:hypothetical protein [Myxococcales bacterium]
MNAEIVILGDKARREPLVRRLRRLGYHVTAAARPGPIPEIPPIYLVCLAEVDARAILPALRPGHVSPAVVLLGEIDRAGLELADVLEFGAERVVSAEIGEGELAQLLAELAGPASHADEDPEASGLYDLELDALGLDAVPDVEADESATAVVRFDLEPPDVAHEATAIAPTQASAEVRSAELVGLLWSLADDGFTGVLRVLTPEVTITMADGAVIEVRDAEPGRSLLAALREAGLASDAPTIPVDALDRSIAALVEAGVLKPGEERRARTLHLLRALPPVDEDLSFTCAAEPVAGAPCMPLGDLLVAVARRRLPLATLRARAGPPGCAPNLTIETGIIARRFSRPEALLTWLASGRSLAELRATTTDEGRERSLLATLWVLDRAGVIAWAPIDGLPERDSRAAIDRGRIDARLRLARRADYFTLLGISQDACELEVAAAYEALAETFADEALEPEITATMNGEGGELTELRAALRDARDVLLDPALRTAYRALLDDPP